MAHEHNLDLFIRRRGLGVTQTDIARALGFEDKTRVSKFERGQGTLPHGLTREDYERALDELVRERLAGTPA